MIPFFLKIGASEKTRSLIINRGIEMTDDILNQFGVVIGKEFWGIEYRDLGETTKKIALNVIPERYRDLFTPTLMKINTEAPPHTDSGARAVINIYLVAGGYATGFHTPKSVMSPYLSMPHQTDGITMLPVHTDEVCAFTALDGDVYLINGDALHSVYMPTPRGKKMGNPFKPKRLAISLISNEVSFEECVILLSSPTA